MSWTRERTTATIERQHANTLVLHRLAVLRGGGAIVMVALLLLTDTFRGNTTVSRWRDPVWLGWLAVPLYLVHQFEEYSLAGVGPGSITQSKT